MINCILKKKVKHYGKINNKRSNAKMTNNEAVKYF